MPDIPGRSGEFGGDPRDNAVVDLFRAELRGASSPKHAEQIAAKFAATYPKLVEQFKGIVRSTAAAGSEHVQPYSDAIQKATEAGTRG